MSGNPQNEIIKSSTNVLTNVPLPAKVKKLKIKPVLDFQVPLVELIYKADPERSKRVQVNNCLDTYQVFLLHWDLKRIELVKQLKVLLLTNANQVLGMCEIASGSMDMAICDPKFIFSAALLSGAGRIILGNNNTSSSLKPSEKDINLTMTLAFAGRTLGVEVLDHIIFSKDGYFSFRANDLIKSDSLWK